VRIVAGQWRGKPLVAPKGDATRPTADRMRETLFNMLTSRLGSFDELAVVDLFAGSGALGLEALSRGAAHCLFVEQDAAALTALRQNIKTVGADIRASVRAGSVMELGPPPKPVDLILLDPPYGTGAGVVALHRLLRLGWLSEASWAVLETGRKEDIAIAGLRIEAERQVGRGKLTFLRLDGV
jgi:16S rRNA (guanine966-N2)-methyltransferase